MGYISDFSLMEWNYKCTFSPTQHVLPGQIGIHLSEELDQLGHTNVVN